MAIGRTWCPSWSEQRVLSRLAAQDLIPGQPDGTRDALLRRQEILIERLRRCSPNRGCQRYWTWRNVQPPGVGSRAFCVRVDESVPPPAYRCQPSARLRHGRALDCPRRCRVVPPVEPARRGAGIEPVKPAGVLRHVLQEAPRASGRRARLRPGRTQRTWCREPARLCSAGGALRKLRWPSGERSGADDSPGKAGRAGEVRPQPASVQLKSPVYLTIVKGVKQKGMKNDLGGRRRNLLGRGRLPHPSKRRPRSDW